jgi:UDP-2-acetamido-3-amino-2,3-dideoxy-glucuronate N-acetyltransferase
MESPAFFKHVTAIVESPDIGRGTRISAFAHVLPSAVIGEDCSLQDQTFIGNDVHIGNRVAVNSGVRIPGGVCVGDDVYIGPNATLGCDARPRSIEPPARSERIQIKAGAWIGASAIIVPGITVGENAIVSAGAVVTRDVPPLAIVAGNPAGIIGYDGAASMSPGTASSAPLEPGFFPTRVPGVTLRRMTQVQDLRGILTFGETGREVPFEVKRYFLVYGVSSTEIRGEHAHRTLHQFLICIHGRCHVVADDGQSRQEFVLDHPSLGVHIPPMIWAVQYKHSPDAVLMVFASDKYDASDYIRNYSEFLDLKRAACLIA